MNEGRGVALAILGIVALIAVVGLVMLFSGTTGKVVTTEMYGGYGQDKVYGNWEFAQERIHGSLVKGVEATPEGQNVVEVGGKKSVPRTPSYFTTCPAGLARMGAVQMRTLSDEEFAGCVDGGFGDGSMCCPQAGLNAYG